MDERVIKIEKIDPKDLFGPQNKNIKFIKLKFPELKIVARGDKIKAYGNKEALNDFEERLNKIINHFIEYNTANLPSASEEKSLNDVYKDVFLSSPNINFYGSVDIA